MNIYRQDSIQPAEACIIWMHGLGADAQDMAGLAGELKVDSPIRHIFLDAPERPVTLNNGMTMRAWYDIVGLNLTDREDKEGILASQAFILDVLDMQIDEGFPADRIFLAGFSQGGAMALQTGLQLPHSLAGIIGLSTYLPLRNECNVSLDTNTPIFLAAGKYDPLVLPLWTQGSRDWIQDKGFKNIAWHEYPMEHSVCLEEIKDLSYWLTNQIKQFPEVKDM